MGIVVSKLWGNNKFKSLTNNSKLLYLYLVTNTSISYVGVVANEPEDISKNLSLTLDQLRDSMTELVDSNYIYVVKAEGHIYWIVPSHFSTVGNSDSMIEKIKSDMKSLPEKVVQKLESIGISSDKKRKKFDKPTVEEIEMYAMTQGYLIEGKTFYDFYQNNPKSNEHLWYDGRGKLVMDWKAKLRKVWFKDDRKLKLVAGAPKGFEYFHLKEGSSLIFPDGWKEGKPFSKDFLLNKKLQKEFEKIK